MTFPATPADFAANRSPRGWKTGAVIAIASGAFLAGCVGGCTFGVLTSRDSPSALIQSSPPPTTASMAEKRRVFESMIGGLPIGGENARMVALAACLAFKQNPNTTTASAARQLAQQQDWTTPQSLQFLMAATTVYCPEYRLGS